MGIDPGTAIVGFGIIEIQKGEEKIINYGCIKTEKNLSPAERLKQIGEDLENIIEEYAPEHASVEKIFFSQNTKTVIGVSQSRGVILEKLHHKNVRIGEYTPQQVKSAVCSEGKAKKKSVQKMVQLILNLAEIPEPDDAADALALALCHAQYLNTEKLFQ